MEGVPVPAEIGVLIFSFLAPRDLATALQVHSSWNAIGQEDSLWKAILSKQEWDLEDAPSAFNCRQKARHYAIYLNSWVTGKGHLIRELTDLGVKHAGFSFRASVGFLTSHLIITGLESSVRIWDIGAAYCRLVAQLIAPGLNIYMTSTLSKTKIVVASTVNHKIIYWDVTAAFDQKAQSCLNITEVGKLTPHGSIVWALDTLDDPQVPLSISGCSSGRLVMVDLLKKKAVHSTSIEDCAWSICVDQPTDTVFVGGSTGVVRTYSLQALRAGDVTMNGHTGAVKAIKKCDDIVVTGSWDHSCKLWDVRVSKPIHTIEGRHNFLSLYLDKLKLVTYSNAIRVHDMRKLRRTETSSDGGYSLHVERDFGLSHLQVRNHILLGSTLQGVKIWSFSPDS